MYDINSSVNAVPDSYFIRFIGELKLGLSGKCMDGSYMDAISSISSGLACDIPDGCASGMSGGGDDCDILLLVVLLPLLDLLISGRVGGGNIPSRKNC